MNEKKKWYEKIFLPPGEKKWLQLFYNIICEVFTWSLIIAAITVLTSVIYYAVGSPIIGKQLLTGAIGLAISAFVFYLFGMLLCNLLYNIQITKYNSDKTVELLEKILYIINPDKESEISEETEDK